MVSKLCLSLILLLAVSASAQFKNDNVLYKTVDPSDLCSTLEKNKGYLLLDVRTPGEYADTSAFPGYNLGHFKNAKNIPVNELGGRLSEISQNKDKPVFVYCSHSQRSRRASKMLADSGFTKVFNINGGMTAFHYTGVLQADCLKNIVEIGNSYSIISFNELCSRMKSTNPPLVIDVRSDSAFHHISRDPKENAMGVITGATNLPMEKFNAGDPDLPRNRDIILVDIYGDNAAHAAAILSRNGYKNVAMLIEGIDRVLYTNKKDLYCTDIYIPPAGFRTMTVTEYGEYSKQAGNYVLVDVRSSEEFSNTHKDTWRNIGHIRNAINIPATEIAKRSAELDKNKEIFIYSFGSGKETFDAVLALRQLGFTKIMVIYGGIFNMRWTAGNVKGQSWLKDLVMDVPEVNQ